MLGSAHPIFVIVLRRFFFVDRVSCRHHGIISSGTIFDLRPDENPTRIREVEACKQAILASVDDAIAGVVGVEDFVAAANLSKEVHVE